MNIELLLMIGGLSLLDTLSPATLGVTVYLLLTEKDRLGSRLYLYLLTVACFYFIVGVVLKVGFGFVFDIFSAFIQNRIVSWLIFSVGVILFVWSFYIPNRKKTRYAKPSSKSNKAIIALGMTTSLVEVGTALPYFAAIGLMTDAGFVWYQWFPVLIGYNFVMVLPPVILYILHIIFGRTMQRPLNYIQNQISKQTASLSSWILCIVGLLLIYYSLDYL
ncbi:GAP family protein [Neobacillus mesonae]|nr:GAP family protein [Neobacillus mesonae]